MTHEALDLNVLLVGEDAALLEGLSQSFAGLGYRSHVATSLHEAREIAADAAPLLAVVERELAASATSEALSIKVAAGAHWSCSTRPTLRSLPSRWVCNAP